MACGDAHATRPKKCPKCQSTRTHNIPETETGLLPWGCRKCGAVGWRCGEESRIVGDPMDVGGEEPKPARRRRRARHDHYLDT